MSVLEHKRLAERVSNLEKLLSDDVRNYVHVKYKVHCDALARSKRYIVPNTVVITLCINYSDKLEMTLRRNARMFKTLYVITIQTDENTINVCKRYRNVKCIFADNLLHYKGAVFNKSAMIRHAQDIVHSSHPKEWVLLLDADIVLPRKFPAIFKLAGDLDKTALYSMYRVDFHTKADYIYKTNYTLYTHNFMGFFQLYYDKAQFYPKSSDNCGECDFTFCNQFTRKIILSDFDYVCHLGQDTSNWNGRVSEWW